MSVFTKINSQTLIYFLSLYDLGELSSFKGIEEGVENTNYFVDIKTGKATVLQTVLTIFENNSAADLIYFMDLVSHLADSGSKVATPFFAKNNKILQTLAEKPACLMQKLKGSTLQTPNLNQCREIGETLANLHKRCNYGEDKFQKLRADDRGLEWMQQKLQEIEIIPDHKGIWEAEEKLKVQEFYYKHCQLDGVLQEKKLRFGTTHGDLFPDNSLFDGNNLAGVIDFYYACDNYLLYDLSTVINFWSLESAGDDFKFNLDKVRIILKSYLAHNPDLETELEFLLPLMHRSAYRYWLSRLQDKLTPRDAQDVLSIKDPNIIRFLLQELEVLDISDIY